MSRRAFTLVELAICLSLLIILTPMVYRYALDITDRLEVARWHLATADAARTVAEALQQDARRGPLASDAVQFAQDGCTVRYAVEERALVREDSCAGRQTLARGVEAVSREAGGVSLRFSLPLRVSRIQQQDVFVAVEVSP